MKNKFIIQKIKILKVIFLNLGIINKNKLDLRICQNCKTILDFEGADEIFQ